MRRAGFWARVAAVGLDLALFLPLYFAAVFVVARLYGKPPSRMWEINPVRLSATVGNALWLVYSSSEWLWGGTPGKLLLRMRIASSGDVPVAPGQLFVRWAMKQSVRIFGLLDAITLTWGVRMLIAKSGLAFFYHEPMNFTLARYAGEACGIVLAGGFLLVLWPGRLALHDRLTGTAVYRKEMGAAKRGFEPVSVEAIGAEGPDASAKPG